jgi:two-component system chemotaxis response regulator CheB
MDGITFLEQVMRDDPIPVVICSSLAAGGSENAMRALELGALAIVEKPKLGVKDFIEDSKRNIIEAVFGAAQARFSIRSRLMRRQASSTATAKTRSSALRVTTDKVIVIGASTGGTEAIRAILNAVPPETPGIVIVQHMPEGFTAAFAQRLNETSALDVKEAVNGDRVIAGRALIAPGNHHLELRRSGGHYIVEVSQGPPVNRHRPSVEVLFQSAARAAGVNALGIILTGMGDDGSDGLLALRQAGAHTIAQDEATSVVFGMPKEAIRKGGAVEILSLERVTHAVNSFARKHAGE